MGEDDDRCGRCGLPSIECFDYGCPHDEGPPTPEPKPWLLGGAATEQSPHPPLRVTPARDYRIRVHTDRIDGPIWLRLLAQLGYALGVAGDECYGVDTSWVNEPA